MTIRKGGDWGQPGGLPAGAPCVGTDAALRAIVESARRAGAEPPVVGLVGGDLCRTLGGPRPEARLRAAESLRLPIDVVAADLDGETHWFVAHLVARRPAWSGRFVVAANADHLGRWAIAPRAHPGDGLVDVLDGQMRVDDRLKARRRLPSGDHLPHPGIVVRRVAGLDVELDRPLRVRLDGQSVGRARRIALRVEPDALTVVV